MSLQCSIPNYIMPPAVFMNTAMIPVAPMQRFPFGVFSLPFVVPQIPMMPIIPPMPLPVLNFGMPTFNSIKTAAKKAYHYTTSKVKSAVTTVSNNISAFGKRIVENARNYLGYNEKDGSYKKFTNGKTQPRWCALFATYVARESGANIPHFSSVNQILSWGRNRLSNTANVGDIVVFKGYDKNGKKVSHTGIVSSIENGKIKTIEGNTTNRVGERSYNLNDSRITGFISLA